MIKESVNAAIAAERARHENARNDARGSRPAKGQGATPVFCECTFAGFMKCNPIAFYGTEGAVELQRWFEKTESVFGISEQARGQVTAPDVRECTFVRFMKCNPDNFHGTEGAIELRR
uniref:Reverse transcriptase domain-containing protein n=1 Tax=Tanacetum cinerariifolium TaxID=118510 RepID=A0A699QX83_TANCI|nr:hypothetical protein [Tanacetum cinerariifolium]